MYNMYEILVDVFLFATGALMWCLLISFCCMCIEHLFFKKQIKPRLTEKEIILIKEVLAGNISLPLVANDGLFVECVDCIERIFEQFISRSGQQIGQLEELKEKTSATQMTHPPIDFDYPFLDEYILEPENEQTTPASGASYQEILDRMDANLKNLRPMLDKVENKVLLEDAIYKMDLPKTLRCVLRKKMGCHTIKDVLESMLYAGSRNGLLEIRGIGDKSADRLESFMFDNGLIYKQGHSYKSDYADVTTHDEPNE